MKNKMKTWKTTKFTGFFYRKCDRKPILPQKVWKTFLSREFLPWVGRFTWNTNIFFLGLIKETTVILVIFSIVVFLQTMGGALNRQNTMLYSWTSGCWDMDKKSGGFVQGSTGKSESQIA